MSTNVDCMARMRIHKYWKDQDGIHHNGLYLNDVTVPATITLTLKEAQLPALCPQGYRK